MKTSHSLRYLLALIIVGLLGACAMYPKSGQQALAGTWTNSLGTAWTIHTDGTFDVDLNHDGKRDTWGKVVVSGDTVTIIDQNPKMQKKGNGVYHFTRSSGTLHFTLVKDAFKMRSKHVLLDWTLKK